MRTKKYYISAYWQAARPKTLVAACIPVLLANAYAWGQGSFSFFALLVTLLFALLVQVGSNYANDYLDFAQGADTADRRGPKRMVAAGVLSVDQMKRATVIVLSAAFLVGLNLLFYGGWWLLPLGLSCIACAYWYTAGRNSLAYLGLGDLFVLVFFGWVAVMVTAYVQMGHFDRATFWLALIPGLLATNLLVVNNYRDVDEDRRVGKRTLVVRWGKEFARKQFAVNMVVALLACFILFFDYQFSLLILLPFVLIPEMRILNRLLAYARDVRDFESLLARCGRFLLLFGVLALPGVLLG